MGGRKPTDNLLLAAGAVEMLAGALMSALPEVFPQWIVYTLVAIGAVTLAVAVYRLRADMWDWLLNKALQRDAKAGVIENHHIADIRAVDCQPMRKITAGPEWDRLNNLLQNGDLNSWCRTKGFKNLRPVPANFWKNNSIEFESIDGVERSLIADHNHGRKKPWDADKNSPELTTYYDVYFNRAQLRTHWPDIF